MTGIPFVNGRYTKGVSFLPKMLYKRERIIVLPLVIVPCIYLNMLMYLYKQFCKFPFLCIYGLLTSPYLTFLFYRM